MEKNVEFYKEQCQQIVNHISESVMDAKSVTFSSGNFCPQICFIRVDALDKKITHTILI